MADRRKVIPYLASLGFYRSLAKGERPEPVPINRTLLAPGLTLTVPVEGGSGALKRLLPDKIGISQHGRWQRVHLGALEARLGRTPFWRYLEPDVAPLIADASGSLVALTSALDTVLSRFLDLENLVPELRETARLNPERLAHLSERFLRNADPALPLLVQGALNGRDAIFTLTPAFID